MDDAGLAREIFSGAIPNPTIAVVQEGLGAFQRSRRRLLRSRLAAVRRRIPRSALSTLTRSLPTCVAGRAIADPQSIPIMAIPTTAGTAAEVTINYVITDEARRRKFVCVSTRMISLRWALYRCRYDGRHAAGVKAATGVDALTYAIEGYITWAAWALTDALHIKAIEGDCRRVARFGSRR
ncbi:hypothetical protein DMH17_14310 [Raoultella planticola]|nr:hypothetical protein [Raoultella planticola]